VVVLQRNLLLLFACIAGAALPVINLLLAMLPMKN
jgi:hypothetical protein